MKKNDEKPKSTSKSKSKSTSKSASKSTSKSMTNSNSQFGDQEMITDALNSQKAITGGYNNSANECAAKSVMKEFVSILNEEHQIQHDIFESMTSRGWYVTEAAEKTKITQAKKQFKQPKASKK